MCAVDYFKAAYRDYKSALALYKVFKNDEMYMNNIAYFLQQSVEKTLKEA